MRENRARRQIAQKTTPGSDALNMFRSPKSEKQVQLPLSKSPTISQSSGFQPINKPLATSQPFTEDESGSDKDASEAVSSLPIEETAVLATAYHLPATTSTAPLNVPRTSMLSVPSDSNDQDATLTVPLAPVTDKAAETPHQSDGGLSRPIGSGASNNIESDDSANEWRTEASDEEDKVSPSGEESFAIDKIINHRYKGDRLELLVRWEDYGPADDTWEPESTLKQDAPDTLEEYFGKIGGRPVKSKRGRPPLPKSSEKPKTSSAVPREKRKADDVEDDRRLVYSPNPRGGPIGDWEPPAPTKDAWDSLIEQIHHLEKLQDDRVIAAVSWLPQGNDGIRYQTRHSYWTVRLAAPLALRDYYEREVLFVGATPSVPKSELFAPPTGPGLLASGLIEGPASLQQRPNGSMNSDSRSQPRPGATAPDTSSDQILPKRAKR